MTEWTTFAGITGVVLVLLLGLSQLTQSAFSDSSDDGDSRIPATEPSPEPPSSHAPAAAPEPVTDAVDSSDEIGPESNADETVSSAATGPEPGVSDTQRQPANADPRSLSTGELLANVALSQGLFALVLLGAVIYTAVPADALGIDFSVAYLERGLVLGTAFGIVLYVANEIGAAAATRFGFDHDEQLRELLAPDSKRGWLALLVVVLPVIAVFEELLFRAALIGVLSTGFGVSPWLLAVGSSIAFALGHGMQGSVGIVVTGALGFVLAGIFILTGSFLVVVVAHYLINALEFVVHEGVGLEWAQTLES
ncbi:CPBP family glutamic-type intramembrane protease [Natronorubrum thiooxidans]|uniref:Membrane protease YdiL, CAAX protease family n=1 Tax=Natronorubrum thiooxidans TaxID=308853 RepID=A0A1N7F7L3_9EURY|nr:CPBP family glutamic-type intramembrane protease [Natronorubrum thiooxidans]SIR96348.1 Membrane protease YdiL, CAAX protease family [Natronorubrum thiooxidans]